LKPELIILPVERLSISSMRQALHAAHLHSVRVGVALLPKTSLESVADILEIADHVLVFAGSLGHQGGVADMTQLEKVFELKRDYPDVEIGWDGGISDSNIVELKEAGVTQFNVGGFIAKASSPYAAYVTLTALAV
jgi:ribulose-phosphate 3-epimerase